MPRLLSHTLIAVSLLFAAGCDSAGEDSAQSQIDADLTLELGESASSDGLAITFEAVTTDSRCPVNAECIWAGEARVRLLIDGTAEDLLLSDPEGAPNAFIRRGTVIVWAVGLAPYPGSRGDTRGDTPVVYIQTEIVSD